MKLLNLFGNDNQDNVNNNFKIEKRKRKVIESDYKDLLMEYNEMKDKYITLLEEKSEKFDNLVYYHDLSKEQSETLKDNKKEIGELKGEIKLNIEKIEEQNSKIEELESELSKIKKKYKVKEPKSELQKEIEDVIYGKEEK